MSNMATQTKYLGLTKPAGTEPVSIDVLNGNFDKIDAGVLKALRGKAAHNLLDNSDFRLANFIAQAGFNGKHGSVIYAGDRWESVVNNMNHTIDNEGLTTNAYGIYQKLSNIDTSKVYTIAVWRADGSVVSYNGTFANGFGDTVNGGVFATIGDNNIPYMQIGWTDKKIKHAALYEGAYTADTLPDYIPKGYAAELAECQRYFVAYPAMDPAFFGYVGTNSANMYIMLPMSVPMRIANPTLIGDGGSWIVLCGGKRASIANPTLDQVKSNGHMLTIRFMCAVSNTFTPNYAVSGYFSKGFQVSADL